MAVVLLSGAAPRNDAAGRCAARARGRRLGSASSPTRAGVGRGVPPLGRGRARGCGVAAPAPPRPRRVRWLPAAAYVAAARALAAERVGEGLRADLEGRAQERHAVGAEGEAVHRDPHAIAAPAAGLERDEGAAAAVAETPAGGDRALDGA